MKDCLEQGHFVGILADRSRSSDRQVSHDFLGSPAQFSVSAFRMMAIVQKPAVLMVGLYRGGNRYDIHIEHFADPDPMPHRPSNEELAKITGRYVARMEHYCRMAPYNWFNFYDFWK
jgi:predicted LPLAT superfamily acyltransferase